MGTNSCTVSVDATLLNTWALLKLSGCAKSCLLVLLLDSPSGELSSLSRYQLARRLKLGYGRSTVNDAVDCLLRERLIVINSATKKLGLVRDVLAGRSDEFCYTVAGLNSVVPADVPFSKPEIAPAVSHIVSSLSGSAESDDYGKPDGCVGEPDVIDGKPHAFDGKPNKNTGEPDAIDGNPHAELTEEDALRCLNLMVKVFVPFVARKYLKSEQVVLNEVQSIQTTAGNLLFALARVYQAVAAGEYIEDLPISIADAEANPQNWPAKHPVELLFDIRQKMMKDRRIEEINDALNKSA